MLTLGFERHAQNAQKRKDYQLPETDLLHPHKKACVAIENSSQASKVELNFVIDASGFNTIRSLSLEDEVPTQRVLQCDLQDKDKPYMVTEYADEIFRYNKGIENIKAPTMYAHRHDQKHLNVNLRAAVVSSVVQMHLALKLDPATLHLTVSLFDKYCSGNVVERSKLVLIAVAALLVASKFEATQVKPLNVSCCLAILGNTFSRAEFIKMESKLLEHLGFNVSTPTCHHFIGRFLRVGGHSISSLAAYRASYYAERCLQEHGMLAYKPSLVAASVVYLAARMEKGVAWTQSLRSYSGYSLKDVLPCARQVSVHVNTIFPPMSDPLLSTVRNKFMSRAYLCIGREMAPVLTESGGRKRIPLVE